MLSKLRKPVPDRDRVVIIEENGVADIAAVYAADEQAVYAESAVQEYAIPAADLKSFVGPSGRIFLLCAEPEYVRYTKQLAELQKSIVLRQVTHFQKTDDDTGSGIRIGQILMYALIGVLVLGVIFK